jgi:hypothetical protein
MNGTLVAPAAGNAATISNGLILPGNTVGGFGYSGYVSRYLQGSWSAPPL